MSPSSNQVLATGLARPSWAAPWVQAPLLQEILHLQVLVPPAQQVMKMYVDHLQGASDTAADEDEHIHARPAKVEHNIVVMGP